MAMALFLTPAMDVMERPDGWTSDYTIDIPETVMADDFTDFDHEPDAGEIAAALAANEVQAELRQWGETWRLRRRFPVTVATPTRGNNPTQIYVLSDARLPLAWGRQAIWWWVTSTAAKLKALHDHLYTTLGFGPVAGALAALDPNDTTRFLANAVQTATGLSNAQQLARVTAMRNALVALGYAAAAMTAIVDAPAGKTEDDLIRALVGDLGFTMPQLFGTMIRMD